MKKQARYSNTHRKFGDNRFKCLYHILCVSTLAIINIYAEITIG